MPPHRPDLIRNSLHTIHIRAQCFDTVTEKWCPPAKTTPEPVRGVVRLNFGQSTRRDDIEQSLQSQAVLSQGNLTLYNSFCDPPSEIIAFQLANTGCGAQAPNIPDTINIGQHLEENREVFRRGLELNQKVQTEVEALIKRRLALTQHNVSFVLALTASRPTNCAGE